MLLKCETWESFLPPVQNVCEMAGLGWSGQAVCTVTSPPFGRCTAGNGVVPGGNSLGEWQKCTEAYTKLSSTQ